MNPLDEAHVLVVDDDADCGRSMARWLESTGFRVSLANGPTEADSFLAVGAFDAVLSDVRMPGNTQLEWIDRVLRKPAIPPVILITGNPELPTAIRAANLPIAAYLVKPPDLAELKILLQRAVQLHRQKLGLEALVRDLEAMHRNDANLDPRERVVLEEMCRVGTALAAERRHGLIARIAPSADAWRFAVADAVAVLEKTKQNFRSKELGALRQRLSSLLSTPSTPDSAPEG
ncbi:response regulator [Opitutus sp. ER46]|uniref:response regulator n=1 Tax=Opitutus sp. ER46 TaxID=2161864 RepID=UPI000D3041C2|nr:response regulator [Opitutus sp. ER46]PTX91063.1 hypothetical protein DB354_20715 [Opitutus sp. ER46]